MCSLGKLQLVIPATNAASERSFTALKRVETFFRATIGDARLDQLMMLHVHSVKTDKIDHVTAANEFVGQREKEQQLFGKFTGNRIPLKLSFLYKSTQTSELGKEMLLSVGSM